MKYKRTMLFQFYCICSINSQSLGLINSLIRSAFLSLCRSFFFFTTRIYLHPLLSSKPTCYTSSPSLPYSLVCFSLILFFPTPSLFPESSVFPSLPYFHGQTLATGDSTLLITPESTVHLALGCKATAHMEKERGEWRMGKW